MTHPPLTEYQHSLYAGWLANFRTPMRYYIGRKRAMYNCAKALGYDDDDIEQAGHIGLIRAARSFDRSKSVAESEAKAFVTHACWQLYRELSHLIYQATRVGRPSHYEFVRGFVDVIPEEREREPEPYHLESVMNELDRLDERTQYVLRMRHGIGCDAHTQQEIAADLGVTRARVYQIESRAMRTIRANVENS